MEPKKDESLNNTLPTDYKNEKEPDGEPPKKQQPIIIEPETVTISDGPFPSLISVKVKGKSSDAIGLSPVTKETKEKSHTLSPKSIIRIKSTSSRRLRNSDKGLTKKRSKMGLSKSTRNLKNSHTSDLKSKKKPYLSNREGESESLTKKKKSLDSSQFSSYKKKNIHHKELKRRESEPFLNTWEYGNIEVDFNIPGHGSVQEYFQKRFDKKSKYKRLRKKKKTPSPDDSEVILTILKNVDEKFKNIAHSSDDVVYEQVSEKEIKIMAGTKEKLFTLLADHRIQDKEYIDIFLAAHLRFMSTPELLESLLSYFENPLKDDALQNTLTREEKDQYIMLIRLRIVNIFKKWLKYRYAFEFEDESIKRKIEKWIDKINSNKELATLSSFLKTAWLDRMKTNFEYYEFDDEDSPKSILVKKEDPSDFSFLDIAPLELARQITLLNQKYFHRIRNNHLLEIISNNGNPCNPIAQISKFSKTITSWVITEIVLTEHTKKMSLTISNFVRLCHHLVGMNNFHGALDIYLGLSSFLVNRLGKIRKGISSSTKEKWKQLDDLFKPDGGWRALRGRIKTSSTPIIIPPAIWLHDLMTIGENDDYWESENKRPTKEKLINFHKLRMFSAVFQEVYNCQLEPYNFSVVESIQIYLTNHLVIMSNEDLEEQTRCKNKSKTKDPLARSKLTRMSSFSNLFKMRGTKKDKPL